MSSLQGGVDCLVLDGGVLIEWFCWRYTVLAERSWPANGFQLRFLRSSGEMVAWERALRRYPGRTHMSAYAIAEVQRHVRDGERASRAHQVEFRRTCWRAVQEALRLCPVREHHIVWTDLEEALLHDYGPADASLVKLAQDLTREGRRPCIVTQDGALRNCCRRSDLHARDPHELIAPEML